MQVLKTTSIKLCVGDAACKDTAVATDDAMFIICTSTCQVSVTHPCLKAVSGSSCPREYQKRPDCDAYRLTTCDVKCSAAQTGVCMYLAPFLIRLHVGAGYQLLLYRAGGFYLSKGIPLTATAEKTLNQSMMNQSVRSNTANWYQSLSLSAWRTAFTVPA